MSSYWDLIQETKVQVEINKDEELAELSCEESSVAKEASDFIESQLFFLTMDEAGPEQPVYELRKDMPKEDDPTVASIKKAKLAHLHGTASLIVEFPFEGWDLDTLAGEDGRDLAYMLEIISKEESHVS